MVSAQIGSFHDPICGTAYVRGRLRERSESGTTTGVLEYDVKAAMLYHCLDQVQWPAGVSSAAEPTLTLGILGKNPFGESLNNLVGKTISGRRLVVKKVSRLGEAAHCQAVFVSSSERKRTAKILKKLAGLPVLTVGETPGFAEQGGVINLLFEVNHIRLEFNPVAAEKARLVIDPEQMKLLPATGAPTSPPEDYSGS